MHQGTSQEFHYDLNPYDSFMRNHLKHYGYYTGKNESYRSGTTHHGYDSWEQTQGFHLSDPGSDTDYENQALEGDKLDADNQLGQDQKRTTQLTFSYHAGKMVPKLREPRGLYALSKEPGPQQAPRWPADMEVLPEEEQPQHIDTIPPKPEPFNEQTGYEKMPQPIGEGEGRVVYYSPLTSESYFLRSRVGGSRAGCPNRAVKIKSADDTTLLFESRFESGNLMKATQVSEFEYELMARYDLYTDKHTQWFYFRVQNARPGIKYRFTIINFMKPGSLYNNGMRPLMYSEHGARKNKEGWRRCGEDIKYYKNYIRRTDIKGDKSMYSLTWTVTFPYDDDTYYLAHCYPYTYSDLQQYLLNMSNDPIRSRFCKQRVLCRSLAGNMVYILTITSPAQTPQDARMKRAVVVTARVHPGETNSSWMMKGFLDYLTSNSPDAKLLRDTFVFKIVPMLNPDGVIVGNYRCSLAGRDLNRNYKSVLKDSFPSVSHTKAMIKKLIDEREVLVYCDLHGHSRKQNVFIYGCENKKNPNKRLKERVFPVIMGRNAADKFNFEHCKFKVQKSKDGTGRVVMWQMGIMNSYTMEATFCGSTLGSKKNLHFTTADFEDMGYHFCDSLLDYCDPNDNKCNMILTNLLEKLRQDILRHLERTGTPLPENGQVDLSEDFGSSIESSTTGSDSSADDGLPVHLLALAPKLTKKKKLKTRKERDKKRNSADKTKDKDKEQEKDKEKDKPSSGRLSGSVRSSEGDKKPGSSNKDKMRYRHGDRSTLHSAGRERHAHHGRPDGVPVFAQERCDDRTLRKRCSRHKEKSEYLEALTNAYLMSGVLKSSGQDVPSLRYSAGNVGLNTSGVPLDGLCPHHEKALAEQFVANQLADLQFADDKFNWSHHAMDTAKAVEALSQRDDSAVRRQHDFNNHMVTMSALHQAHQKPLNDYIRNSRATSNRPNTGKRSVKSPIKMHPSPFEDKSDVKKGYSSTTISLKGRCPSATNFTVYDGQPRAPSRERRERPTSSKASRTGMESPSSSQTLKRNPSSHTSSSCSPADHGLEGAVVGQGKKQLLSSNSVAPSRRPTTQPVAELDIDSTSQDIQDGNTSSESGPPKPVEMTVAKVHRCATEATPITDLTTYTNHHRTERSSHHFKKVQNFYGKSVLMDQERSSFSSPSSARSRTSKLRNDPSDETVTSFRTSLTSVRDNTNTVETNANGNNSSVNSSPPDGQDDQRTPVSLEGKENQQNAHDTTADQSVDNENLSEQNVNPKDTSSSERKNTDDDDDDDDENKNKEHSGGHQENDKSTHDTGHSREKLLNKEHRNLGKVSNKEHVERPEDTNNNVLMNQDNVYSGEPTNSSSNLNETERIRTPNEASGDEGNVDGSDGEAIGSGYKSHFKLALESELFQQQVARSPRYQPNSELNLSGSNYSGLKQYAENYKAGKGVEIPQTDMQHTKSISANSYSRNGAVSSNSSHSVLRQRQAELSPRLVDKMKKYHPLESPITGVASQSGTSSPTKGTPRQSSSRMSKVILSPREYDITESLYPERIISPQSTSRYIQVSRLALQMRMGGDQSPTNGDLGFEPLPPGSPGCEGAAQYHFVKQQPPLAVAAAERMTGVVFGQSFGESYVSPARKRLESHRPVSGRQSAKGHRSPGPSDSIPNTVTEDVHELELQGGGVSGFKTKPEYLRTYARKK